MRLLRRWPRMFSLGLAGIATGWAGWAAMLVASGSSVTGNDVRIREVMAGANGASRVQFLVIDQVVSGQNLWGPQGAETQSRAMLVFYDNVGRETGIYKFPTSPGTGGTLQTLVATAEFAALLGAPTPDITIPRLLHPQSGKVCFVSNPLNETTPFRDCVSYGSYVGDTGTNLRAGSAIAAGSPAAALPITDTASLRRGTDTGRNVDFALTSAPTPTNLAGATMAMAVDSTVLQGERIFTQETFGGNGRTCATCHVPSQSFGLQPFDVQARFSTVSTTYDPLFVAETTLSGAVTTSNAPWVFDYNLNTLTLTAAVATGAPCTGELRGLITNSSTGARAMVIARTSATTYLVGGGVSPVLSGTMTDGTCTATVAGVSPGSLGADVNSAVPGLEDPRLLRTTRADADLFPFGRALFLENIDQLTLDNVELAVDPRVFRKSPHLLNLRLTGPFGFSGDVLDLKTFSTGAVKQHLPRTLVRSSGGSEPDFRLPTDAELVALEAFQLAQEFPSGTDPLKFDLDRFVAAAPISVRAAVTRGRNAFFGEQAKCSRCHGGSTLSQMTTTILGQASGTNGNFDTGIVNQVLSGGTGRDNLPCEPSKTSVGPCGTRKFSVPQLFNVKNLTPLFHDSSAADVRTAVAFYNSAAFNDSPAGQAIGGICMSSLVATCTTPGTMVQDIAAFLEALVMPRLSANSTTSLTALTNASVSPRPSVLVRDDAGTALAGVTVTFAVAGGGGSVTGASAVSDASGIATIGSWTLGAGANSLTATFAGATGSPVTFNAFGTAPAAGTPSASPASLRFAATKNGATLTAATAAQSVTVAFSTGATSWTASSNASWLQISSGSGSGAGTFNVAIVNTGDVIGTSPVLTGTITISAPGAAVTSVTVPVTLAVTFATSTTAPFGQVDTPTQNADGIQGAIGVTGWTLDNIGVTGVKIYRNCLVFEAQASCQVLLGYNVVEVGDAAFLAGARPDVEAAFATYPSNHRAGWGYLMLTSMLPHVTNQQPYGGQGPLTLYAVATDIEGNRTLLGRSSDPASPSFALPTQITMTNDSIAKPFGAIDTPAQGATVSGVLHNFGWALTPDSNTAGGEAGDILIPTNGSTMTVFIDGLPVAVVAYNQCRGNVGNPVPSGVFCNDDVANIFGSATPQPVLTIRNTNATRYRNLDSGRAAIGVHSITTTTLTNGLHTIAWSVTDSAGRTEGIGSRFFNVLNSGSDPRK